jgi:hypothetical protein
VNAHQDVVLCGRPGDSSDFFVAERSTVAEMNLQRMLDFAQTTAPVGVPSNGHLPLPPNGHVPSAVNGSAPAPLSALVAPSAAPPAPLVSSAPVSMEPLPRDEVVTAIRGALRVLGSTEGSTEADQRYPVRGTHLKTRLRQQLPGFEENAYGYTSFLDFLLSMRDHFRVVRAEIRGDVLVAERESPADLNMNGQPEATPGGVSASWAQSPEQRYLAALRIRRIRHVPMEERYEIINTLCQMFSEAHGKTENLSLKEAKDRLHHWFEENQPSVPWDSVNNAVYHLFWTYCFEFGEAEEEVPLWDRPTHWNGGMDCADEVIRRCDMGLVRMISEVVGMVDPRIVIDVLGDGDMSRLAYFEEICNQVNQRFAVAPR